MKFLANQLVNLLGVMPDGFIWRFAKRYIAGPGLDDAMAAIRKMNAQGLAATMDVLGEDTRSAPDANRAVEEYLHLIDAMADNGLTANLSIKLTQMGLDIDFPGTLDRVARIARKASENGMFFRMDIEDSSTTDRTYDIYRRLRRQVPNVGAAIQAYLFRSEKDLENLVADGPTNLRICKGIYKEPADIAHTDPQVIRSNFVSLALGLIDAGGYTAIATHDRWIVNRMLREIRRRNLKPDEYEFQMLYGVGLQLRKELLELGHRVRIYIPYGVAWKPYSLRRFRENPTLAWYIIKNLFMRI